jgi:hypothetical protein
LSEAYRLQTQHTSTLTHIPIRIHILVLIFGMQKKRNLTTGTKVHKPVGMATFNFALLNTYIATDRYNDWLTESSVYILNTTALHVCTDNSAVTIMYKSIRGE